MSIKRARKMNEIKLGIQKDETTNFEKLICPYCKNIIDWNEFYDYVDPYDTLSTDSQVTNNYTCPKCKKQIRVCLDVLIHAEKENNN